MPYHANNGTWDIKRTRLASLALICILFLVRVVFPFYARCYFLVHQHKVDIVNNHLETFEIVVTLSTHHMPFSQINYTSELPSFDFTSIVDSLQAKKMMWHLHQVRIQTA